MQTECIYDCTRSFVHSCILNASKFTGKERDAESGLDMFGARYYGSSLGRFMTPDWAAKPTNVPYASFGRVATLPRGTGVNPCTIETRGGGGWRTLPRGTGVNPCTIETRGGAESFLRLLQKRFGGRKS